MTKSKRGGARKGAGPKIKPESEKRVSKTIRLHPKVIARLNQEGDNFSRTIEKIIMEKYEIFK